MSQEKPSAAPSDQTTAELIDFAIITAVEVERVAVCRAFHLTAKDRVRKGSRVYWRGKIHLKNKDCYELVVVQSSDMANVDIAIITNDTIHHWDPRALLLVGIAAAAHDGSNKDDEALGDLIIGNHVYYYERGKETASGRVYEPYMYPANTMLLSNILSVPTWKARIPVSRPDGTKDRPRIFEGVIASGERVIAEAAIRDEIASGHRKIRAIEMEGYGFSKAVFQSFDQRCYLVMKAICDRGDRKKGDDWQPYASAVAAGFAKHFLQDQPLKPRSGTLKHRTPHQKRRSAKGSIIRNQTGHGAKPLSHIIEQLRGHFDQIRSSMNILLDLFGEDKISPKECDRATENLRLMNQHSEKVSDLLNSAHNLPKSLESIRETALLWRYRIDEQVPNLAPQIEEFRSICLESTAEMKRQREDLYREVEALDQELSVINSQVLYELSGFAGEY